MKTAVKHCVSSAYQIGTDGGVEGRRGPSPASYPIQLNRVTLFVALLGHNRCALTFEHQLVEDEAGICQDKYRNRGIAAKTSAHCRTGKDKAGSGRRQLRR